MSLRSLSDQQILSRIQRLTQRERSLTLAVLLHLNEIERRRLHLKQGYSSMFDYCTSGLGYSASAASRRIRAARCVARFPEVYELLQTNEVNVSTIAQVSRILTTENHGTVLARIRGKSQREVEAVVAEFEPIDTVPRDRVRTVVVRVKTPTSALPLAPASVIAARAETSDMSSVAMPSLGDKSPPQLHDRYGRDSVTRVGEPARQEKDLQRRAMIQFSASEAFMAKLERVRSLCWHQLSADASFEQVFEFAMDLLIARKDPTRRSRRERPAKTSPIKPRQISAAIKREVYVRDKGQCTFVGPNGRRCASTKALQLDHVKPVAFGGSGTTDNLRLLCAYHNRFEAERLLSAATRREGLPSSPRPPGMH